MRTRVLWAALIGSGFAIVVSATAVAGPREQEIRITTGSQTLATALLDVAAQGGIELVLTAATARTLAAPKIHGRYSLADALTALLADSGLTWWRSADGLYVVSTLARAPTESHTPAMPDILVIGRKTQNSDIRRSENDIQPYKVWTSADVAQSHSADLDDFLRNHVTGNAQIGSAAQLANGRNASEVNLRGLGSGQTLVLVDGRRLPSGASGGLFVSQPDLNGIPLRSIERIEVLNSTAGGIYGPGATAGVINVVLKHDYHGADLGMSYGVSARGDAITKRLDARLGVSSANGRTQVTIAASRSWGADLRVGDRDFTARALVLEQRRDPRGFAIMQPTGSRSVNIDSASGGVLSLDAAYGGASLGAASTSVPVSYGGVATDGGALYRANAGRADTSLSPDASGAARSLLTSRRLASLLATARHGFGSRVEGYVDLLLLENAGQSVPGQRYGAISLAADAPGNPFQQDILVSRPFAPYDQIVRVRNRTARLTGGLILGLPRNWKANADYSRARASIRESNTGVTLADPVMNSSVDLLADQASFVASLLPNTIDNSAGTSSRTDASDLTLHLAGPVVTLGGGPLSLSALGEDRRERYAPVWYAQPGGSVLQRGTVDSGVRSAYVELRAPLVDSVTGIAGLRGLELQLALRYDATRVTIPDNVQTPTGPTLRSRADALAFTAGLRFSPVEGVTIRASTARGFLPPMASQIGAYTVSFASEAARLAAASLPANLFLLSPGDIFGAVDTKRGNSAIGSEAIYTVIVGGSTHLRSERARSLSVGIVLTPAALERFRLSVDYTRIDKRDEIVTFHTLDSAYILANESRLPGRVIRAPLTDADRAKGFTAGVVTGIDTSSFNIGTTLVEAIDVALDYRLPTGTQGDVRIRATATWQPRLTRRNDPDSVAVNAAGYADGPLTWRANGGVNWQRGALDFGINATYFHGYRAANSTDDAVTAARATLLADGVRIPAQVYVDAFVARSIALRRATAGFDAVDIRFGIQNLFDHRPPIIVDPSSARYSLYGDPRLRRVELNIIAHH
jgi:iron complex outermembrane receptor protein